MFEQILDLVRQSGQQSVVENPEIPNEHNDAVMQEASSSITNTVTNLMQTQGPGAVQELMENVQSGNTGHPAVQQLTNQFSGNIMQKFGINAGAAQSLAGSLIPMVLGKIMNQGGQGGGGFDIGSMLGSFMGGGNNAPGAAAQSGGMLGNLSAIGAKMGLDKDGDGDVDMSDVMGMFKK